MKEALTFLFILVITFIPWIYLKIRNWCLKKYKPNPSLAKYIEKKKKFEKFVKKQDNLYGKVKKKPLKKKKKKKIDKKIE